MLAPSASVWLKSAAMKLDIKARLRERGLRQKEVAARLGVSEPTMSAWIKAVKVGEHTRIPAEQARPLAKLLEVPPGDIRPDLWPADPSPAAPSPRPEAA